MRNELKYNDYVKEDAEMELFAELLVKPLENGRIEVTFPDLKLDPQEIVEIWINGVPTAAKKTTLIDKGCNPERVLTVFIGESRFSQIIEMR